MIELSKEAEQAALTAVQEFDRVIAERNAWNASVPQFAIYADGSQKLGRCYNAYYYRVESRIALLESSIPHVTALFFRGHECYNRSEKPAPVRIERFTPTGTNPRDGKAYPEQTICLYCYRFETRIDSSD